MGPGLLRAAGIAGEALAYLVAFDPVGATEKGFTRLDGRLPFMGPEAVDEFVRGARHYLRRLTAALDAGPPRDIAVDLLLAIANLRVRLFWLADVRWHEVNPLVYLEEALNGVFTLLLEGHRPPYHRLASAHARLAQFPRFFREAQINLRAPWALFVDLALETVQEGHSFLGALAVAHPELARAVREARRALERFGRSLERVRPSAQARIHLGEEAYRRLLAIDHFLEVSPDELVALGEHTMQACRERAAHGGPPPPPAVRRVPPRFGRQEVLDYYRWEIGQVRRFIARRGIVTLPRRDSVAIVENPPFLARVLPEVSYQGPPPFGPGRGGVLFVAPIPDPMNDQERRTHYLARRARGFRKEVVHEIYPGHHLQMARAAEHPSPVRRCQANDLLIEGWALYCEELMEREGLYPDGMVSSLRAVHFRAARVVIDASLQTGRMGIEEAMDVLASVFGPGRREWTHQEVLRYLTEPGQAMTYLVGKVAIDRLREEYAEHRGPRSSPREFHDRLLSEGSIPPALLASCLVGLPLPRAPAEAG